MPSTNSFAESRNDALSPFSFESKDKSSGGTILEQTIIRDGESAQVPIQSKLSENYALITMDLSLKDIPNDINAWIDPNEVPQYVSSGNLSADAILQIYADSNAQPGNYTIRIVGTGLLRNQATGEDVQLTDETLGLLHLTIMPAGGYSNQMIIMDIGEPVYENKELCVDDDSSPGGGTMCLGFIAKEEFPITISSSSNISRNDAIVSLTASGIPEGAWAKFVPANYSLNESNGSDQLAHNNSVATGKLILAGAVKPFGGFPPDTQSIIIRASLHDKNNLNSTFVATGYLPIVKTGNLTILPSMGAITLPTEIINNVNGINFGYYGVVYDPPTIDDGGGNYSSDSKSKSLQVSLSVAGISNAGDDKTTKEVIPVPSWLRADIPVSSFTLNATQPYYFIIKTATSSAPIGNFKLAINETIKEVGGLAADQSQEKHFTEYVPLTINAPVYLGGPPPPSDHNEDNKNNTNNYTESSQSSISYKLSWNRDVKGTFTTVDISDDKSYLAVGTGSGDREGAVYLYNTTNGDLLWNYDTDRRISSAIISSDSLHLAAAGYQLSEGAGKAYINGAIYYFDAKTGQLLWNRTTGDEPVMSFSMSTDGSYIAAGTNQDILYFDNEGRLLWSKTIDGGLDGIAMSSDSSFLFVTASSVGQPKNPNDEWGGYLFEGKTGKVLWNYTGTEAPSAERPVISSDGKYIAVVSALSSDNGFAYVFDLESGELLWKRQINSPAFLSSISSDGSTLAVPANWALLYFDGKTGNLLWNHTASGVDSPNITQVKMTPNGRYIVGGVWGGGSGKDIQLLGEKGDLLWSYPTGTVYSVDISDDGSIIAAGTSSTFMGDWQNSPTTIYFFEVQENKGTIDNAVGNLNHLGADTGPLSIESTISLVALIGLTSAGAAVGAAILLRKSKKR